MSLKQWQLFSRKEPAIPAQFLRVGQELKSFHFSGIKLVSPKGGFASAYSEQSSYLSSL